jgi:hypothetical protein
MTELGAGGEGNEPFRARAESRAEALEWQPRPGPEHAEPRDEGGDPPCWAHLFDGDDPDALVDDPTTVRSVRDGADTVIRDDTLR